MRLPPDLSGKVGVSHVAWPVPAGLASHAPDLTRDEPGMTVFWDGDVPVGHVLRTRHGALVRRGCAAGDELTIAEPPRSRIPAQPDAKVSVVICTRDRPDELARCLASLPGQSRRPDEIIVVDNASRDGRTRDVAEAAKVTYVREDRPGLDIARNTGARAATGELIAYTDDDVSLHEDWLLRLVAAFDRPTIGAVTGLVLPAELATEAQLHFETYWSFGQGYRRIDFTADDFARERDRVFPAWKVGAGASMAFRRLTFERVGWFDERLDVGQAGCSGDSEYWYRILAGGLDCRYEPAAVAFHFHRRDMAGLSHQIHHYMRGHAAALMVQRERTGINANLRQALWVTPAWYARRLARRVRRGARPEDRFLDREILGYLSGLWFYLRRPRETS